MEGKIGKVRSLESKKVLRSGLSGGREGGKIGNLPPYLFIREREKTERDVTSVTCPPAEGVTSLIPRDQVTCPRAKALGQVTWPSGFGKLLYVTSLYPRAYKLPRAIALGSLYALGYRDVT